MAASNAVIHVVDDDAPVRAALSRVLDVLGFEVRQYGSAGEFLLAWPVETPGCLLLDVRMPGPSGLDLQLALARREDALPVVFLTGYGDIPMSVMAIRRGAVDFLTKPVEREALLGAVTAALQHDADRREGYRKRQDVRQCFDTLTPRERTVFAQVVLGRRNKQIAGSLGTCERTVKAHRAHVMEKLKAHSVAELVLVAVQLETALVPDAPAVTMPSVGAAIDRIGARTMPTDDPFSPRPVIRLRLLKPPPHTTAGSRRNAPPPVG